MRANSNFFDWLALFSIVVSIGVSAVEQEWLLLIWQAIAFMWCVRWFTVSTTDD